MAYAAVSPESALTAGSPGPTGRTDCASAQCLPPESASHLLKFRARRCRALLAVDAAFARRLRRLHRSQ
ncbi:hypothetical protein AAV94_07665 [Lampropedia cohaerens]|uniref:Uncharacterized protein n=1 Tax=Lampropedia cohaerens TaxID=1610491 RepID=A0A0U1PZT0_9BURK|nr:hypothetical protein AAV94_07665 [Lampropedia cohaerens]